jgi:hypothetical protein
MQSKRLVILLAAAAALALGFPLPMSAQPSQTIDLVSRARVSAVYDIEVVPPYAYALERGILRVLDVHDPTAVREIDALELESAWFKLTLHHRHIFLTGYGHPMAVLDISDPIRPRWMGELAEFYGTMNDGFEIVGDVAYLVRHAKGDISAAEGVPLLFDVLDLADPASPRRLGNLDLGVRVRNLGGSGIAHADGHVFILHSDQIIIVDARVPARPRIERMLPLPEGKRFVDVEVRGDLLFLLQHRPERGLAVYRIREEGEPELLGEAFDTRLLIPVDLIVSGDVVYATFKAEVDLAAFDVSNPRDPLLIFTYTIEDLWAAGLGMTIVDNRLYVAGDGGPTPIFDVSEPQAPHYLGRWEFEGGWVGDVLRTDDLAILTQVGGGIIIYDVANPRAPQRLARYQASRQYGPESWQWNVAAAVDASRLLMAYETLPAELMDISDPTRPAVLGKFKPKGLVHAIMLTPKYAFLGYRNASSWWLSTSGGGIEVIDLSNPKDPSAVADLDLNQAVTDLELNQNLLVATHPDGSLTIVDIRNPTQPIILSRFIGSGSAGVGSSGRVARIALSVDGDLAYIVQRDIMDMESASGNPYFGQGTLTVVDLHEATEPRVLGQLDFERRNIWDLSLAVRGNRVVIYTGNILIVDVSNPAQPTVLEDHPFPHGQLWVGDWVGLALDDKHLYLGAAEDGLFIYRLPPGSVH